MSKTLSDVKLAGPLSAEFQEILTPQALQFLLQLHLRFDPIREELLQRRKQRQKSLDIGCFPDFLSETANVRSSHWAVAEAPHDLLDRRVEITGPVESKMMINALNSGANVFMADLEDSCAPTWENVIQGQVNLRSAVCKSLTYLSGEGKSYSLNDKLATLVVRPRGWHLFEKHATIEDKPMSASLFDFGLFFFHNANELIARGSGPYFYLPKLESHLEARLWNDVFCFSQEYLQLPSGTIRATVLIETILAAFEMEEILFELRDHACGLNAGRWDYIFSIIKKFNRHPDFCLPDRAQVTMTVPFMQAYCSLLVDTCHRRGAHAMGGMAAFIPSRKDPEVNERALANVRKDKEREARSGFDGTWVAHPDLVPVAREEFDKILGQHPHQKSVQPQSTVTSAHLLNTHIEDSTISQDGLRNNVDVALQYIESWLCGVGAAAIHNLMEDAATAEIARAQIWQWIRHGKTLVDGAVISKDLYSRICAEELARLKGGRSGRYDDAKVILDQLIDSDTFVEFLTSTAYAYLD